MDVSDISWIDYIRTCIFPNTPCLCDYHWQMRDTEIILRGVFEMDCSVPLLFSVLYGVVILAQA